MGMASAEHPSVRVRGDVVDLDLPMPARLIEANPLVEETLNKVAVQRGPVVYCLESADLPPGSRLLDVVIPAKIDLVARYDRRLLGGVVVLDGEIHARSVPIWNGELYRELQSAPMKSTKASFIPYSVWGNRDKSEMSDHIDGAHGGVLPAKLSKSTQS